MRQPTLASFIRGVSHVIVFTRGLSCCAILTVALEKSRVQCCAVINYGTSNKIFDTYVVLNISYRRLTLLVYEAQSFLVYRAASR